MALIRKTVILIITNNNVLVNDQAHNLTGKYKLARNGYIF